ncbi:uncharacterized protein AC631_04126 [Debaryomyces fabryi]|uniref:THO complex subunit HPR1 n=1 Tax=Debaryomyces fabryi TaxID=58627 RepID=A0A0V1PV40_9ASCO|nr:uncharacterized protein AC631_04126 [Debaryomyces fabryi]KSA00125.1 hypothetical protein AC631_04126 [Debaryomyces fabryi]CUM57006.1 unnamed protein product [Debaryomyces fabryi]
MATESNRLSQPIELCFNSLIDLVNQLVPDDDSNYLLETFSFEKFIGKHQIFEDIIKEYDFDYKIDIPMTRDDNVNDEVTNNLKKEIENFNLGLDEKTRDFVLTMAFQKAGHEVLAQHLEELKNCKDKNETETNKIIEVGTFNISREELRSYNRLSILVDFQMHLVIESYPSLKSSFYQLLSQILQVLFNASTHTISIFWYYLETRKSLIQDKIFDKQVTSDRISFLEICNTLTDRFFEKNIQGKRDLCKKDTFNDTFQYRVRMFIANIFNFEDNTGLNKYFSTSNRIVKDFSTNSRSRDDSFIKDVIQINKLFRDPYYYLKPANHKQLTRISDTLKKVYEYLMEEEINWSSVAPKIDQFAVPAPKSEAEEKHLKEKYANKLYFPENYSLAQFDEMKRGESFDQLKKQDYSFMSKQFDDSKIRQTCLVQIYFICHLYYELNAANKKVFLRSLNGPANIKHFTDDSPPDSLVSLFFKIKREIPKRYRSIDSQFSFLLQHMAIDETFWWGWLIYGKDPNTGKSLFVDKVLTASELAAVQEKTKTIIPFKEKRYFNNYATPQLSRKMKVERGLLKLVKDSETSSNNKRRQEEIDLLTEKISNATNKKELEELIDERNVLTWKHLKKERNSNWLQFGNLLNKLMLSAELNMPEAPEKPTESIEQPEAKDNTEDIKVENNGNIEGDLEEKPINNTEEIQNGVNGNSEDKHEDQNNIKSNPDLSELDSNAETSGTKRSRDEDEAATEEEPVSKKSKN